MPPPGGGPPPPRIPPPPMPPPGGPPIIIPPIPDGASPLPPIVHVRFTRSDMLNAPGPRAEFRPMAVPGAGLRLKQPNDGEK